MKKDSNFDSPPLAAWFLGPKAEHSNSWQEIINYILQDYIHWRRNYFPEDPIVVDRHKRREHEIWFDTLNSEIDKILNKLKAHYPFYSPRYIAHMLSEQSLPSVVGYFAGMLYNPNNVTDEAAPITVELELEAGKMISEMLGYDPNTSWAHLTSGGTLANIEALWVARSVSSIPLIIRDYCEKNKLDFIIKQPNNKQIDIRKCKIKELLFLDPNISLSLPHKLSIDHKNRIRDYKELTEHFKESEYNISQFGINNVYNKLNIKPLIFISESAHYSIKKAANLLGLGEECVSFIPVESNFRMNVNALKNRIYNLRDNEVILSVIAIAGTTEEGSVDPIHEIIDLRNEFNKEKNRSFWIHIDAAWGGYIRSMFNGTKSDLNTQSFSLEDKHRQFIEEVDIQEKIKIGKKEFKIDWSNPDLFFSFLAMNQADSITIDPHKLGYVPYPAGAVCYKNCLVTESIIQKAQYITDEQGGLKNVDKNNKIKEVGPFILEGSKPGAAAAACWLAHKTIPLNIHGHGKIIKTSLLNSRKLYLYLSQHKHNFNKFEEEISDKNRTNVEPFTFEPLFQPDTNLVCFIAVPMVWCNKKLIKKDTDLNRLNLINGKIYEKLSIKNIGKEHKMPYSQDFFVSRTQFTKSQYDFKSLSQLLNRLQINNNEYNEKGLFVLRSTVMNPWYYMASKQGVDFLWEFIKSLHFHTRNVFQNL